jgi:hypothetical protein
MKSVDVPGVDPPSVVLIADEGKSPTSTTPNIVYVERPGLLSIRRGERLATVKRHRVYTVAITQSPAPSLRRGE